MVYSVFRNTWVRTTLLLGLVWGLSACSVTKIVVNRAFGPPDHSSDASLLEAEEDPVLILGMLPAVMKTLEALHEEVPNNPFLAIQATQAFLLYANGYVAPDVQRFELEDYNAYQRDLHRLQRLYTRARIFALRGLRAAYSEDEVSLALGTLDTVVNIEEKHIDVAYWLAAAWGLEISAKGALDPDSLAQLPVAEALIRRVEQLDSAYGNGAVYEYLFYLQLAQSGSDASVAIAMQHFRKAEQLSGGQKMGLYVSLAEKVAITTQDRELFRQSLQKVIDFDLDSAPEYRLLNTLARQQAVWMLANEDEWFI